MDRESHVTRSGTVIYWVDTSAGIDSPWIAFLPGLTADRTLFDAQMAFFAGKANCLAWDAPAHGESRPYPLDFTMDGCACILHGILEKEGIAHRRSLGSRSAATCRKPSWTCSSALPPVSWPLTPLHCRSVI